jgi:hypothetical protein
MKTICEGCGKPRAAGGHRFCRACIGHILSQPAPVSAPAQRANTRYPLLRRKGGAAPGE